MSIEAMVRVWEHSSHRGTRLLAMLALADFCNMESIAWPHISTIAQRIRSKERQTQATLRALEETGELYTHFRTGRTSGNFYLVAVALPPEKIVHALTFYLLYSPEQFQDIACVGCGRCIKACPVNIDIREVINDLQQLGVKSGS